MFRFSQVEERKSIAVLEQQQYEEKVKNISESINAIKMRSSEVGLSFSLT